MNRDVLLLLAGGAIGLASSIITSLVNAYLQSRQRAAQWKREDALRRDAEFVKQREAARDWAARDEINRLSGRSEITQIRPTAWFCFVAGTTISMPDGASKPVEQLSEGERVLTYNEPSRSFGEDTVKEIPTDTAHCIVAINRRLHVSHMHRVLTTQGWQTAIDLTLGSFIVRQDNSAEEVTSIEWLRGKTPVFGVALAEASALFANGYCVSDFDKKNSMIFGQDIQRQLAQRRPVRLTADGEIEIEASNKGINDDN